MRMGELGVALIGTGYMGKAHAHAWRVARAVMGDLPPVRLELLCDVPEERAAKTADRFGFARFTANWREVAADPRVDVVSIAAPNHLHRDVAVAALAAGKHVWCEKPMALTLEDAGAMAAAARRVGRVTLVGYNYLRNPAVAHAARLIAAGRIGRPVHFRGVFDEDYQADGDLEWTWRARRADAGLGALADMGCHVVSIAQALMGPIASVVAETQIVHETRPTAEGGRAAVENEDAAGALVRFASGAQGYLGTSRASWGRKNGLDWEVHGTAGAIRFTQERMNELRLFLAEGPEAERGFRTVLTGPAHPPYGAFVPSAGHQLGFLDLKAIEAAELLRAVAGGPRASPDFGEAVGIEAVIHAMDRSAATGRRVTVSEMLAAAA